ncbi:NAD(P)H-dependent oxidoreductase subunit E [Shewanella sp. GXUN23E]|uniref:NAD(P)H-dependent oxidoreductase subunit E n=1 Tax=Shewanella sp. GXUN23E TaxID=3422498 RepID=UPI003D7D7299
MITSEVIVGWMNVMTGKEKRQEAGIWKQSRGKGKPAAKGRMLDELALQQIQACVEKMPKRRDLLIEYLHRIQDSHGGLRRAHIKALAHWLNITESEVVSVASFYSHFDLLADDAPGLPDMTLRVCNSLSCTLAGSDSLARELEHLCKGKSVRILRAPCMGRCDRAPAVMAGHNPVDNAIAADVLEVVEKRILFPSLPVYEDLDVYLKQGGYAHFRALESGEMNAGQIELAIDAAGLRGMGGAGFPSGRKWAAVRAHPGPRLMAVNADEGEPGTFKDRYYLETRPHLILEGMLLAAKVVDAEKIYIYVRDEYPAALKILTQELEAMTQHGLIASDFVELRRGAGSYICGEESAMLESIEGKRGLPRQRPPYVAEQGLFGRPTLVHNIETLYWIARVCREGEQLLRQVERNGRTGMRTYSVSGRVVNPGVYLLAAGSSISDIILAAGGMAPGHEFYAFQPGGPSSGLLPARLADVPLDFDTLQPLGSLIGSAAVVILSTRDSVRMAALNMMTFFHHESCGQCTPCRLGCDKALTLMQTPTWDVGLLTELGQVMSDASICGLGQAAPNVFRTLIRYFPDEV